MHTRWIIFEGSDGGPHVEAQVFTPAEGVASEAILFCPGFPGMGAPLFEQRHAATLAHEGYALYVLRHGGTRFDTPHAPMMINNARRLMTAREHNETMIGGRPATIKEWLLEPYVALKS